MNGNRIAGASKSSAVAEIRPSLLPRGFSRTSFALAYAGALAAGLAATALAAATPDGGELSISPGSATLSGQAHASVAVDADGDYVVAWQNVNRSNFTYTVYARRFNAAGGPLTPVMRIDAAAQNASVRPQVASDSAGNFVVTWAPNEAVVARRFAPDGSPLGNQFSVVASSRVPDVRTGGLDIAMEPDGDFVVTYGFYDANLQDLSVYARRFAAAGTARGGAFLVDGNADDVEVSPSVAVAPDGRFVIAWAADDPNILARQFDGNGTATAPTFTVNIGSTDAYRARASVAMNADGAFVVGWQAGSSFTASDRKILARPFDATGSPISGEITVAAPTSSSVKNPALAQTADGAFVVLWDQALMQQEEIRLREFQPDGSPAGADVPVSAAPNGFRRRPAIATTAGGNFLVAWDGADGAGALFGIFGQRFVAALAPADLSLGIADTPDPVRGSGNLSYTLTASNLNPPDGGSADGVQITTGALPAGASFVGLADTVGWTCTAAPLPITCARTEPVAAGESDSIDVVLQAPANSSALSFSASVSSDSPDPNLTNNSDTETTTVEACAGGSIGWAVSRLVLAEEVGLRRISAVRDGGSCGAATARVRSSYGTADAGDLQPVDVLLSWADGASGPRAVDLHPIDDPRDEPNQTATLTLSEAVGANLGAVSVATLVIRDDDAPPVLSLSFERSTVNEGGARTLNARLSAPSEYLVRVPYTVGGTASAGADYSGVSDGSLTIARGLTERKLARIVTTNDSEPESDETVIVTLGAPLNATPGSPGTATLVIRSDE